MSETSTAKAESSTEDAELPAPQFRKTKQGKWAVMGPVPTLEAALAGDGKVKVLKKSGDWSSFTVVSLGRPFDVEGVMMAYGYDDEGEGPGGSGSGGSDDARSGGSRERTMTPPAPPRDDSEPLPEFQGGPEDEWQPEF